jgi:hypothetical protein
MSKSQGNVSVETKVHTGSAFAKKKQSAFQVEELQLRAHVNISLIAGL